MTQYSGKIIRKTPVVPSQTSASGVWTTADAAAAVKNNTWPVAGVPNPISRSVRLRSSASAYFNRTPASAGNRKTWTWSGWVKRGALTSDMRLFEGYVDTSNYTLISFDSADRIQIQNRVAATATYNWNTTAVYRDSSAWYHIVVVFDTTQATSTNRIALYVNGVQITAFGTQTTGAQNADTFVNATNVHDIGRYGAGSQYFDGYLTEVNFIDGQALTPSSFGTTDSLSGAWIPMPYTGTYGTNGFYLNFKDNTSTTTLGYDYSGNSNNWTANNISLTAGTTYDSMVDVPTLWMPYNTAGDVGATVRGNYATLNPLANGDFGLATLTNGNLDASGGANYFPASATLALNSGKWYYEFTCTTRESGGNYPNVGFWVTDGWNIGSTPYNPSSTGGVSTWPNGIVGTPSGNTTYTTWTVNDVVMFAYDADSGKVYVGKNGTWFNSGVPASGTGSVYQYTAGTTLIPGGSFYNGAGNFNFGQRPFSYTPPSGFKTLNTFNLPAPTINNGASYMAATLYAGSSSAQSITNTVNGVSFQPDLVWGKNRSNVNSHRLTDVNRGVGLVLFSNSTNGDTTGDGQLSSFNSNGWTFTSGAGAGLNESGNNYVAWNWKAGGTPVSNTTGSITSQVSANTAAGFSVVTFTGTGSAATVGHGLGVAPQMVIAKTRNGVNDWFVYTQARGATKTLYLNLTNAEGTTSAVWNNTAPTSTVFTVGTTFSTNTCVAYCFAAVAGYSAFGSYTGNGSADGPFVYLGFRPRWLMIKNITNAQPWIIVDTSRNTYNQAGDYLQANSSAAENGGSAVSTATADDILSNGFKLRNNASSSGYTNGSGDTYIYAAFAENPFKYSNAR